MLASGEIVCRINCPKYESRQLRIQKSSSAHCAACIAYYFHYRNAHRHTYCSMCFFLCRFASVCVCVCVIVLNKQKSLGFSNSTRSRIIIITIIITFMFNHLHSIISMRTNIRTHIHRCGWTKYIYTQKQSIDDNTTWIRVWSICMWMCHDNVGIQTKHAVVYSNIDVGAVVAACMCMCVITRVYAFNTSRLFRIDIYTLHIHNYFFGFWVYLKWLQPLVHTTDIHIQAYNTHTQCKHIHTLHKWIDQQ